MKSLRSFISTTISEHTVQDMRKIKGDEYYDSYYGLNFTTKKEIEELVGPINFEYDVRGEKTFYEIHKKLRSQDTETPGEELMSYVHGYRGEMNERLRRGVPTLQDKKCLKLMNDLSTTKKLKKIYRVISVEQIEKIFGRPLQPGDVLIDDGLCSVAYDIKGVYEYVTQCRIRGGWYLFECECESDLKLIDVLTQAKKHKVVDGIVKKMSGQKELILLPKTKLICGDIEKSKLKASGSIKYIVNCKIEQNT